MRVAHAKYVRGPARTDFKCARDGPRCAAEARPPPTPRVRLAPLGRPRGRANVTGGSGPGPMRELMHMVFVNLIFHNAPHINY